MKAVGDGGGIAEMMVVVEHGIGERRGHLANLFGLGDEVERAVLNELKNVRYAIRTM